MCNDTIEALHARVAELEGELRIQELSTERANEAAIEFKEGLTSAEAQAKRYREALERIVGGEFDTKTAAIDMQGVAAKVLEV